MIKAALQNMSIKQKLTAVITLTSAIILLMGIAAYVVWEQIDSRQRLVRDIRVHASIVADNCKAALAFEHKEDADEILSALRVQDSIVFACIYNKEGRVFAAYQRRKVAGIIMLPEAQEDSYAFKDGRLGLFKQIELDGERIGTIYLLDDMSEVHAELGWDISVAGVILLCVLGVAYILSSRVQRWISRPILQLASVAKNVSEKKDYSARAVKQTDDEVGVLIDSFNEMLGQIQRRDLELVGAKTQLEVKVRQRTTELTEANEQLRREVAERKRAEQALAELNRNLKYTIEKLKQSNKQLEDFVYIASHDLREPLRKISSFGQLIQDSLKEKLSEDDVENLRFMIDGADRMQQMIDALLMYSRVTTKGSSFERTDLNCMVEELKSLELAAQLEDTKGSIVVPEPLPMVSSDTAQLRQLLQNLISNGLKYHRTEVAPRIEIRAAGQQGNMVRIEVEDNGIGIKEQYCKDIFTMFRRLHTREKYEGSGIGLSVCKRIVERHGGEIGVESSKEQGSVFWFTLALAEGAEKPGRKALVSQES